jgi:conjugal transfer ATP-binding protein TraC
MGLAGVGEKLYKGLGKAIFGDFGGMDKKATEQMAERHPFSDYINFVAYDADTEQYINRDGTVGFLFECSPLGFATLKQAEMLEGIFRSGLPDGSVVQFILYADQYLDPIIDAFYSYRTSDNPLVSSYTKSVDNFIRESATGANNMSGIPTRRYRVFVSAKFPQETKNLSENEWCEIQRRIRETLEGALLQPRHLSPGDLLDWLRRFFNDKPGSNCSLYDTAKPICKQIIHSETDIEDRDTYMKVGKKYMYCTTPKTFPRSVSLMQSNSLFGGIWGLRSDADQIRTPFLYSLNIALDSSLKNKVHNKCNFVLQQKGFGSLSPSLERKQEEYLWATDELEKGTLFMRIMPTMWVWDREAEKAAESLNRVKRVWEANGYYMQEDRGILKLMLISSLPMNLYIEDKAMEQLDRDFIAPVNAVTPLAPIQADFSGGGAPILMFYGRKGQIATLDFFDSHSVNKNFFILATSGSGKSFLVNYIVVNYFSCGSQIRIVDIGGSYKKLTKMLGAKYLNFGLDTDICLNPFTHIQEPEEEMSAVHAVFLQMAFSNSDNPTITEIESNLMRTAVWWAWEKYGQNADSDTVYSYLLNYPNIDGVKVDEEEFADLEELKHSARRLAFNIRNFTSKGVYSKYFVGPSTFDIRSDDFVVLELEELTAKPELFRVVTLLVLNAISADLYLSDRHRQKMIIYEEAWQFLGKGGDIMKAIITEGYRRGRKYNGSFGIVSQSVLDVKLFGSVGDVIMGNSAFKIYLESDDFQRAKKEGILDYDDFTMEIMKSLKSKRPFYSELFVDSPFGRGVLRLAVDRYSYYMYTSDAKEIAEIESMLNKGFDYDQSIHRMIEYEEEQKKSENAS